MPLLNLARLDDPLIFIRLVVVDQDTARDENQARFGIVANSEGGFGCLRRQEDEPGAEGAFQPSLRLIEEVAAKHLPGKGLVFTLLNPQPQVAVEIEVVRRQGRGDSAFHVSSCHGVHCRSGSPAQPGVIEPYHSHSPVPRVARMETMSTDATAAPVATPAESWPVLSRNERRVLGVLIEKAKTTPDAYPLTLNALITGCNQKNNRDPVMQLQDADVNEAVARA